MNENIGIIGGGMTGLMAAYRLSKNGHKVVVFEKSDTLGGLMSGFKINGTSLEKAYHHIFKTDKDIISLVNELNLSDKLIWNESSIGLYYDKKIYPFVTPLDLLQFQPLNLIDKLRLGLVGLYLQKTKNWERFIPITAANWMKKMCGQRAYKIIWEPLLKGKFHKYYNSVSMAWLWARIHTRGNSKESGDTKEKLGYFEGGFEIIIKALEKEIKKYGGEIKLSADIKSIKETNNDKVEILVGDNKETFDKVITAVPNNVLTGLIKDRHASLAMTKYINKLNSIDYLGAIIVVFSSKQSLSKYYWHNINDSKSPFLAFIQHTNLINKSNYKNEHVYYLGTYLPHNHKYFTIDEEQIYKDFLAYLKNIFPNFDIKQITSKYIFRLKNAQHVVTTNYPSKIPDYKTPIKNLFLTNFSQIFPEDRGTNFAVREGEKIAAVIARNGVTKQSNNE